MGKTWVSMVALLASGIVLWAQEPEGGNNSSALVQLAESYTMAMEKELAPLNSKYRSSLADLRVELTKGGDLDGALAVRSVEEAKPLDSEARMPPKLRELQSIHATEAAKIKAPLKKKYVSALERLQSKFTRSGDLDGVLLVRKKIRELSSSPAQEEAAAREPKPLPRNREEFEDYIVGTAWAFPDDRDRDAYLFTAEGEFKNPRRALSYRVTGLRKLTIDWGGKSQIKCEISKDFTEMSEQTGYRKTLRRVKMDSDPDEEEAEEKSGEKKPLFDLGC